MPPPAHLPPAQYDASTLHFGGANKVEGNVRTVMYFGVGLQRDAAVLSTGKIPDGHNRKPAVMLSELPRAGRG